MNDSIFPLGQPLLFYASMYFQALLPPMFIILYLSPPTKFLLMLRDLTQMFAPFKLFPNSVGVT